MSGDVSRVLFIWKTLWGVVNVTSCSANDIKKGVLPSPPGTHKFLSFPDKALSTSSAEQQHFSRNKLTKPASEITDLHFTKKPVSTQAFANKFLLICQDSCWSYHLLRQAAAPLPSSPKPTPQGLFRQGARAAAAGAAVLMGYLQSPFLSWQWGAGAAWEACGARNLEGRHFFHVLTWR